MLRSRYDDYVQRFNDKDPSAFDDFYAPDVRMQNGMVVMEGLGTIKENYSRLWSAFDDTLEVERWLSDGDLLTVQMHTTFRAITDEADTVFGPVATGDVLEYRGLILYELEQDQFTDIVVAYNQLMFTRTDGRREELGVPGAPAGPIP
jgi:hypothetical protein